MAKRLRTFLAIAVTLMMLVQSVSPSAFAQEIVGTPTVENTDNSGDNAGDNPDGNTDSRGDTEQDQQGDNNSDDADSGDSTESTPDENTDPQGDTEQDQDAPEDASTSDPANQLIQPMADKPVAVMPDVEIEYGTAENGHAGELRFRLVGGTGFQQWGWSTNVTQEFNNLLLGNWTPWKTTAQCTAGFYMKANLNLNQYSAPGGISLPNPGTPGGGITVPGTNWVAEGFVFGGYWFFYKIPVGQCTPTQPQVVPVAPTVEGYVCKDGVDPTPTIVLANEPAGITYSISTPIDANGDFEVTATKTDANSWGAFGPGWSVRNLNQPNIATYDGHQDITLCTPTAPVAPQITADVCTGGVYTKATAVFGSTAGVDYGTPTVSDPVAGKVTITATATVQNGYKWNLPLTDGWTNTSATQASFSTQIDAHPCTPIVPVVPDVVASACVDNVSVPASGSVTDARDGITYAEVITSKGNVSTSATIADGYAWDVANMPAGWTVDSNNPAKANYSGTYEDKSCTPATPVLPEVDEAVCTGGALVDPVVTPVDTAGITYTIVGDVKSGKTITVEATLSTGYEWSNLPAEWTKVDNTKATTEIKLADVSCTSTAPEMPEVTQAVCTDGALVDPVVNFADTPGITYSIHGSVKSGETITVIATLGDGYAWGSMPDDWDADSPTTANTQIKLDDVDCAPLIPVTPQITQAVCTGGELIDPIVHLDDTTGITYTIVGDVKSGATITVVATLDAGYAWDTSSSEWPEGWTVTDGNPSEASIEINLDDIHCTPAEVPSVEVTQAVCTGGELVDPSVIVGESTGVTYEIIGDVKSGETVKVVATLEEGYAWNRLPEGWTKDSNTQATYEITLDDVECTPVAPVTPVVQQAVCTGGELVDPVLTVGASDHITYVIEGDIVSGGTVTITATLDDGYAWDKDGLGNWVVDEENAAVATMTIHLDDVECTPIAPVVPVVTGNVCTGGAYVPAGVSFGEGTDGVTYEGSAAGGVITATATITADGIAWGELPDGWTATADPAVISYVGTYTEAPCAPVVPANPVVEQAVCTGGELTPPTIQVFDNERMTYTLTGDVVSGGTVIVTATLNDGFAWDLDEMPAGWMVDPNNPGIATYEVVLENIQCTPVVPVNPEVTPAVCETGKVVDPSYKLPTTPGVTYTSEGEAKAGGKVIVTATLEEGYAWGELPEGWTKVNPATATYEITFAGISCEQPATPPVVKELPKTGSGHSTSSNGILLATLAGAILVAGVVRTSITKRT